MIFKYLNVKFILRVKFNCNILEISMLIVFLLYPSGYTLYIISRNIATVCLYTYTFIPRGRKEGNVLFNNALNTFTVIWHWTYGKGPLR